MTLLGTPELTASHLASTDVDSQSPALASIARLVGGNNRLYYELDSGQPVTGSTQCSPPNPRGGCGHDHSSAGMGAQLQHTFWSIVWPFNFVDTIPGPKSPQIYDTSGVGDPRLGLDCNFWIPVPPCYPGGAYESCEARVIYYVAEGYTDGTITLSLWTAENERSGWTNGIDVTLTGKTTNTFYSNSGTLRLYPWGANLLRVKLAADNITDTVAVYLFGLSLSSVVA